MENDRDVYTIETKELTREFLRNNFPNEFHDSKINPSLAIDIDPPYTSGGDIYLNVPVGQCANITDLMQKIAEHAYNKGFAAGEKKRAKDFSNAFANLKNLMEHE